LYFTEKYHSIALEIAKNLWICVQEILLIQPFLCVACRNG